MSFEGFPEEALLFYQGLEADNTKAYWTDHRAVYDRAVKAPLEGLLADLAPEFGTAKVFRPYRDVRFSKDKTPYKTHAAAVVEGDGSLYVQLGADGLYVGGGYWHTPRRPGAAPAGGGRRRPVGPPAGRGARRPGRLGGDRGASSAPAEAVRP